MSDLEAWFKRVVVGLPPSAGDYPAIAAAAAVAELLRLPLVAAFADDRTLFDVAALSCVRELRPTGGGWHAIDAAQLAREIESAADTARRLCDAAVRRHRIEWRFDLARDSIARLIGSLADRGDIVAVIEPKNPADRITQQFSQFLDAAFKTHASLMMVPSRPVRSAGPIVAIAETADDQSIAVARKLATAAREKMFIVNASGGSNKTRATRQFSSEEGIALELASPVRLVDLAVQLPPLHERLLVVRRRLIHIDTDRVSFGDAPVLIIDNGPHAED